jgi:hypothetical protein
MPIKNVIAKRTPLDEPTPRSADAAPIRTMPVSRARRAPIRAMSSAPGMATRPNSRTGQTGQSGHAFLVQLQVLMNQRQYRRHGKQGQTHVDAGQPQQPQARNARAPVSRHGGGLSHGSGARKGCHA